MERRIGERHRISWVDLRWMVRRSGWRKREVEERVEPLDVSTSGLGLVARTAPALRVGSVVVLHTADHEARAQVRRIVAAPTAGNSFYGLEFTDADRGFTEELFAHAGAPMDSRLELYWRHAV